MLPPANPHPFLKGIGGSGEQQHLLLEGELPAGQMGMLCPGETLTAPPATEMPPTVNTGHPRDARTTLVSQCSCGA